MAASSVASGCPDSEPAAAIPHSNPPDIMKASPKVRASLLRTALVSKGDAILAGV